LHLPDSFGYHSWEDIPFCLNNNISFESSILFPCFFGNPFFLFSGANALVVAIFPPRREEYHSSGDSCGRHLPAEARGAVGV
ncbi:MAG TPA: hypothetical protein VNG51_26765, partial [Ktedonobacteraceae bacterium]|nr:hypothetical protein [Ktedonobacteraceae bacterium]